MTSKLRRLGEKLSGVQGAAQPGCQHPPGAQRWRRPPPRISMQQRSAAARGGREPRGRRRALGRGRNRLQQSRAVACPPRELSTDQTCLLWTRLPLPLQQRAPRAGEKGRAERRGEQSAPRLARPARGLPGKRGRGWRGWEERGWSRRTLANGPEVPGMQDGFG